VYDVALEAYKAQPSAMKSSASVPTIRLPGLSDKRGASSSDHHTADTCHTDAITQAVPKLYISGQFRGFLKKQNVPEERMCACSIAQRSATVAPAAYLRGEEMLRSACGWAEAVRAAYVCVLAGQASSRTSRRRVRPRHLLGSPPLPPTLPPADGVRQRGRERLSATLSSLP
jgi:hypothetical protein